MLNTYPDCVCLVAEYETEFDGAVTDMPDGRKISFVVDDGHKFYGSITRKGNTYRLE
jgi:translation initiation factor IF-1